MRLAHSMMRAGLAALVAAGVAGVAAEGRAEADSVAGASPAPVAAVPAAVSNASVGAPGDAASPGPGAAGRPLGGGQAMRAQPAPPPEAFSWTMLLAWPLAAASAAVAWMLLRRKGRRTVVAAHPPGVSTRGAADGFVVRVPGAAPGTRVRYECVVEGAVVSDVVPLAGEETFVYTGSLPTAIRIAEILVVPSSHPSVRPAAVAAPAPSPPPPSVAPPPAPPSSRPRMPTSPPPPPSSRSSAAMLVITEPMNMPPVSGGARHEAIEAEAASPELAASSPSEPPSPSEAASPSEPPSPSEAASPSDVFLGHPRAY